MDTLIIKTGSTWPELVKKHGDFEQWIMQSARLEQNRVRVLDAQSAIQLEVPAGLKRVIITGSHDDITDNPPWQQKIIEFIRHAMELSIPVLGICYGHQLLAHLLGGEVIYHPDGGEFGITHISLNEHAMEDPILKFMPRGFVGFVNHGQTVSVLPPGAVSLASSTADPHQIVRFNPTTWGVQFHPEFTRDISRHYLQKSYKTLKKGIFMNPDSVNFDSRVSRVLLPLFIRETQK